MVFIQNTSSGYQVIDCNYTSAGSSEGNCKIKVHTMSYGGKTVAISRAKNYVETDTVNLVTNLNYSGKNYLYGTDFSSMDALSWYSRDTDVSTLDIDSVNTHNGYNSLKIVNTVAGEGGKDLAIETLTQGRSGAGYVGDSKSMVLSFWAKATTANTKMYFRWGYEATANTRSVALTTSWAKYTVRMDRTTDYNNWFHPYIDKAGTVWISEMQLEDGTVATDFVPETGGYYQTVSSNYGGNYTLPREPFRAGYTFDGWYTAASGGTQITSSTAVKSGHINAYAHWKEGGRELYLNMYLNYSGKNYLLDSDFSNLNTSAWQSRDTSVATLAVDSTNKHDGYNSLKIVNSAAGSSSKDLAVATATQYTEQGGYVGDNKSMILSFWAKASVSGTKMYFRWAFEPTSDYRSVSLTTSWAKYTVRMDKNPSFGTAIHPYVDRAGTVWIAEVQMEDGTVATDFVPETGGMYERTLSPYGSTYNLPADPIRTGYTFDGWYTAAAGGTKITSSTPVQEGHFVVYAHWKETAASFTVSYDANGGEGAPEAQTKTQGIGLTLSNETPSRAGYTFLGWSTSPDGIVEYEPGETYNTDESVTLYAVWDVRTYTVAYNANGGTGAPNNQIKVHGEELTLSDAIPTRTGYTFKGWATSAGGSVVYAAGATYSTDASVTLYAVWEKNEEPPVTSGAIEIGSATTGPGKEIQIPVSLVNNPGIASFQLDVQYDASILEWTGLEKASIGGTWDAAVGESILWIDADDYTGNGVIFTLTFKVKDDAETGTTTVTVTYDADNVFDENGTNVALAVVPGTITIKTHTPGDINGDGSVNNKDLLWLMKYIKGKDVVVVEEALDVNGDGNRNNKDLLWLMKYLKGKDVVIY